MRLLGNILWFIFFGWWNFLVYALWGVVFCITIIGIPIGKALFQYAKLMVLPFGKVIVRETDIKGKENVSAIRRVGGTIANIIWLPVGIVTFVTNIGVMILCFISIILIPVGIVVAKSCVFLLWPVGAKVITAEQEQNIRMERTMRNVMGMYPGAGMPNNTGMYPGAGMPNNAGMYPGAGMPNNAGMYPGAGVPNNAGMPYGAVMTNNVAGNSASAPTTKTYFCSQCGAACGESVAFCPKCGTRR